MGTFHVDQFLVVMGTFFLMLLVIASLLGDNG